MPDPSQGFASGLMAGMQGKQSLALGEEELQLNQLKIDQTKLVVKQQQMFLDKLSKLNMGGGGGTGGGSTPQDQARQASNLWYQVGAAALASGRVEEAAEMSKTGATLAENAAKIDEQMSLAASHRAGFTANQMDWVLEAKDDPKEASRRWQLSNILFGSTFGMESKYAGVPYTEELAQGLKAASTTKAEEARINYEKAQQNKLANDERDRPLKERLMRARAAALEDTLDFKKKHGGLTPAQAGKEAAAAENQADARVAARSAIAELRKTLADSQTNVAGIRGTIEEGLEFGRTATGYGSQDTPATHFHDVLAELKSQIPAAVGAKNTRLAIVQKQLDDLSRLRNKGVSRKQAEQILNDLDKFLDKGIAPTQSKAGQIKRGSGDPNKVIESQEEIDKIATDTKMTYEEKVRALEALGITNDTGLGDTD